MTVSAVAPGQPLLADGVTTVFPFTFKAIDPADIKVLTVDADGVETTVAPADYEIALGSSGGSVTFDVAPGATLTVFITSNRPFSQSADIKIQERYRPDENEVAIDSAVILVKQVKRDADRSIKIPESEDPSVTSAILPAATTRKNGILTFDSNGRPQVSPNLTGVISLVVLEASNAIAIRDGTNRQHLYVYNTYTSSTDYERLEINGQGAGGMEISLTKGSGGGSARALAIINQSGGSIDLCPTGITKKWSFSGNSFLCATDGNGDIGLSGGSSPSKLYLQSPRINQSGAGGLSQVSRGDVRRLTTKITAGFSAFSAAALALSIIIAQVPAKTRIVAIYADTTVKFIGGAVATATLRFGKTAGGNEYLVDHDVFTAAITRGTADAHLGASINRAAAVQGGDMPSFAAVTDLYARLTVTGANLDQLTQGSVTFYIETEVLL